MENSYEIEQRGKIRENLQQIQGRCLQDFVDVSQGLSACEWLTSIALNVCRDKLRHKSRREIPVEVLPEADEKRGEPDVKMTVGEAVGRLAPELREIVILYYYQEFTQSEISEILKIPQTTVAYRIRTAKAQLRNYLKEELG